MRTFCCISIPVFSCFAVMASVYIELHAIAMYIAISAGRNNFDFASYAGGFGYFARIRIRITLRIGIL